jgi:sugar lactone lactonase YvrE
VVVGAVDPAVVTELSAVLVLRDEQGVPCVAFSPDGRLLATTSHDKSARVWDWASGQERFRATSFTGVQGLAFSPDGELLAIAMDWWGRVFEVASAHERLQVRPNPDTTDRVDGMAFSPDGRLLATASWDGTARVWALVR